jgi:hypothetical protein
MTHESAIDLNKQPCTHVRRAFAWQPAHPAYTLQKPPCIFEVRRVPAVGLSDSPLRRPIPILRAFSKLAHRSEHDVPLQRVDCIEKCNTDDTSTWQIRFLSSPCGLSHDSSFDGLTFVTFGIEHALLPYRLLLVMLQSWTGIPFIVTLQEVHSCPS